MELGSGKLYMRVYPLSSFILRAKGSSAGIIAMQGASKLELQELFDEAGNFPS